jgi:hypothetical protein
MEQINKQGNPEDLIARVIQLHDLAEYQEDYVVNRIH